MYFNHFRKKFRFLILAAFILFSFTFKDDFKSNQMTFPRVREAYQAKASEMIQLYYSKKINFFHQNVMFRAFKQEQELEIWAKDPKSDTFTLIKTYKFCKASGCLGPKRLCGDRQVPEGYYYIDRFNPSSNYYLSLGINYPNKSDKILGSKTNTGGDIFIHGSCVSIGCLAMNDESIKEIYIIAVEARNSGQLQIPVQIFPYKFENETLFQTTGGNNISFWDNLKPGYFFFNKYKAPVDFSIDNEGKYNFSKVDVVFK